MTVSPKLKSFLWGVAGAALVVLLVGLIYVIGIGWQRAYNGQAAWECLHQPACVQSFLDNLQKARGAPPPPKP